MPTPYARLRKGAIRPDWNVHTLFRLSRLAYNKEGRETFFQQKWKAKSLLRTYHHPHVREKRWTRMFDRRLPAVVPMNHKYLAESDGSELSAGRGSGLIEESEDGTFTEQQGQSGGTMRQRTPYMNMTFFPLEKRLETAVFRAMFASSVREARCMILHGGVKVNGKKLLHPGYLLNPGDMFQVEPDRVLYATGVKKHPTGSKVLARIKRRAEARENKGIVEAPPSHEAPVPLDFADMASDRKALIALRQTVVQILYKGGRTLSAKKLQELRSLRRAMASAISKVPKVANSDDDNIASIISEFRRELAQITASLPSQLLTEPAASLIRPTPKTDDEQQSKAIELLLEDVKKREMENPQDPSKPYKTPWRPREFMSAFAFIPRYLEVNHNICSAVYLRHPVARPGLAEVPAPFHPATYQLGFNWYLRRR